MNATAIMIDYRSKYLTCVSASMILETSDSVPDATMLLSTVYKLIPPMISSLSFNWMPFKVLYLLTCACSDFLVVLMCFPSCNLWNKKVRSLDNSIIDFTLLSDRLCSCDYDTFFFSSLISSCIKSIRLNSKFNVSVKLNSFSSIISLIDCNNSSFVIQSPPFWCFSW